MARGSVVIAAHNEASVLGQCLERLLADAAPDELTVVVVANGCTDDTASIARAHGVHVIELPQPGKAAALNAADRSEPGYPRLYLDADILLRTDDVRALLRAVAPAAPTAPTAPSAPASLAAVPQRHLAVEGRPLLVRCYYAVHTRLPVFQQSLFGRGAIAVSEQGRARFAEFPDELGDDLFLDSVFAQHERHVVAEVTSVVQAPLSTRALLRRLVRVRRGNRELSRHAVHGHTVRQSDRWAWLRDVVRRDPRLLPAGLVYAAMTVTAEVQARRSVGSTDWGQDTSTRAAGPRTRGTEEGA